MLNKPDRRCASAYNTVALIVSVIFFLCVSRTAFAEIALRLNAENFLRTDEAVTATVELTGSDIDRYVDFIWHAPPTPEKPEGGVYWGLYDPFLEKSDSLATHSVSMPINGKAPGAVLGTWSVAIYVSNDVGIFSDIPTDVSTFNIDKLPDEPPYYYEQKFTKTHNGEKASLFFTEDDRMFFVPHSRIITIPLNCIPHGFTRLMSLSISLQVYNTFQSSGSWHIPTVFSRFLMLPWRRPSGDGDIGFHCIGIS